MSFLRYTQRCNISALPLYRTSSLCSARLCNRDTMYTPSKSISTSSITFTTNRKSVDFSAPHQFSSYPRITSFPNRHNLQLSPPVRYYSTNPEEKKSFVTKAVTWVKTIPTSVKEMVLHYWSGTVLLGYEIRICLGLLRKITKGHTLTRRERRQLNRTATDLLRLVPFSIFVIIPFMEIALPFAIKLFPNMLPSTFKSNLTREEQTQKELIAKVQVARFLQEALFSRARKLDSGDKAQAFQDFMRKVRSGVVVDNQQILQFASLFEDEFTLDQLTRDQLVAMAQYMQLTAIGTDAFLRYQLNRKINQLKSDDKLIESEGLDTLTLSELQQACSARGLKATSRSKQFLRERLAEWLDLSLKQNLPVSLLILANAFKITGDTTTKDSLRDAMYHLPDSIIDDIRLKIAEDEGYISKEKKLELLKREEEQIKEEKKTGEQTYEQIKFKELQEWIGKEQDIAQSSVSFSASQLKAFTEAVAALAAKSSVAKEQRQLRELKTLLEMRKQELEESGDKLEKISIIEREQAEDRDRKDAQTSPELETERKNVIRMGDKLENYVNTLQNRADDLNATEIQFLLGIDKDKDGIVDLEELREACKTFQEHLPSELVEHVLKKLDGDNDNKISVDDLRSLAEKYDTEFMGIIKANQSSSTPTESAKS